MATADPIVPVPSIIAVARQIFYAPAEVFQEIRKLIFLYTTKAALHKFKGVSGSAEQSGCSGREGRESGQTGQLLGESGQTGPPAAAPPSAAGVSRTSSSLLPPRSLLSLNPPPSPPPEWQKSVPKP